MEQVTLKKIMKYDGPLRMAYVETIFTVLLGVYLTMFSEDTPDYIGYIFVGFGLVGLILTALRYFNLMGYNNSETVIIKATVIKILYYRGTKRITFVYNIQGEEFKKTNVVNYTKATRDIQKEQEIDICIKVENPKKALIREFYFDQAPE